VTIDPDSPLHEYEQLAEILRAQIGSGEIGGRLPSINTLADRYELSPATVKRALGLLTEAGLIYAVRGRGTFVSAKP
jgi:DNA-binding GntR family transcriptional regulator